MPGIIDRRVPGARSSAVARTRFIDDAIAARLGEQTEQLVILGAGFDSRAYRLPGLRGITVFEVDHPDTLATKRRALERALRALPKHVHFVPTDFNQRELATVMAEAGYRESLRTFFVWEGVTNAKFPSCTCRSARHRKPRHRPCTGDSASASEADARSPSCSGGEREVVGE